MKTKMKTNIKNIKMVGDPSGLPSYSLEQPSVAQKKHPRERKRPKRKSLARGSDDASTVRKSF